MFVATPTATRHEEEIRVQIPRTILLIWKVCFAHTIAVFVASDIHLGHLSDIFIS